MCDLVIYVATDSTKLTIASTIITNNSVLRLPSGHVICEYRSKCEVQQLTLYRTAVPQYPDSPVFSLQIDPLPPDPSVLVNNPIVMMFDVVRQ